MSSAEAYGYKTGIDRHRRRTPRQILRIIAEAKILRIIAEAKILRIRKSCQVLSGQVQKHKSFGQGVLHNEKQEILLKYKTGVLHND